MGQKWDRVDKVLLVAGILFLCIFLISSGYLMNYYIAGKKQENLNAQLAELKHGKAGEMVVVEKRPIDNGDVNDSVTANKDAELQQPIIKPEQTKKPQETSSPTLSEINPDYVAWIQIKDTVVDYPVVQRDNSYYLKHNFMQEKNKHGAIFLDESCTKEDAFLLIHGHHMKDGSMFGGLKQYKKKSYREEHLQLSLEWENITEQYTFFAGALIDLYNAERFVYEVLPQTEEEKAVYLAQLKSAAFWYEDISWEEGDRFVILSTCDYGTEEERMILVGKTTKQK